MGHLVPHREVIRSLLARGHQVHIASREVSKAAVAFEGLAVQLWLVPLSIESPKMVYQPTISFAQIMHNTGFANSIDVASRISAWQNLYGAIHPEMILADYSPTALLAARGSKIKTAAIAVSFCLPQNRLPVPAFSSLANLATEDQLLHSERQVTTTINKALAQHGLPQLESLAGIFHATDRQLLMTIPELDPFAIDRGSVQYCGVPTGREGKFIRFPTGTGRRIFAYLRPFVGLESLLTLLNQFALPTLIACDGLPDGIIHEFNSPTMTFVDPDVDLSRMASDCHMAITNGNATTSAKFLLAGKPVLMIPLQLEQELYAQHAESQGLSLSVLPGDVSSLAPKLTQMLDSDCYHQAAKNLAAKYTNQTPQSYVETVVDAIEALMR